MLAYRFPSSGFCQTERKRYERAHNSITAPGTAALMLGCDSGPAAAEKNPAR